MKRKMLIPMAVIAMLLPLCARAQQLLRSGWEIHPTISLTNSLYNLSTGSFYKLYVDDAVDGNSTVGYRFIPAFQQKWRLSQKIETPLGKAKVKYFDWGLRSFSLGYAFGFQSFTGPLGFVMELNYEKQNWKAKLPTNDDYINFSKQMFAPEVCLRFRLGARESLLNFVLEPGVKYNHAFKAYGEYNDKNYVNNGVTGIFGLGYYRKDYHIIGTIRYERDFFDYFNQDFVAPDGSKPYQDFTTKHGLLNICLALCF